MPNGIKIYQMASKYTKWHQNIPNGIKIYQHFPLQATPKFTHISFFGFKMSTGNPSNTQFSSIASPSKIYPK
jgi:hypothetical protein